MDLPQRIFLDTSVINFIVDHSESIFDGGDISECVNDRAYDDIRAMMRIFYYADHNAIEMIISKTTFQEINATADQEKKDKLKKYCDELWTYFHYLIDDDYTAPGVEVKYYEEYLLDKGLGKLSDANDRQLIIEALFYKCDIFCTRDWKTILKHRQLLKQNIPLEILTPLEWCLRYEYKKAY
jgi:predicted nucleic acid-binding protein